METELTRGSLEMFPRSNQNRRTIDKEFVLDLAQEHIIWPLHFHN